MSSSLIVNDLFGQRDLVDIAIKRIKEFEVMALRMNEKGYFVAISGGKDSSVIYDLVKQSGCLATYHHSLTTVDAPENVRHIMSSYSDVVIHRPKESLLNKIRRARTAPPSRNGRRWCCRDYKENIGTGFLVVTGVRAKESPRRAGYRLIEACYKTKSKRFLHPIIDWSDEQVWEYIKMRNLPINPIYLPPFNMNRVGCVLCPLALPGVYEDSIKHWPKIVKAWEKSVKAWYDRFGNECCNISSIKTADQYWKWWLSGQTSKFDDEQQEQLIFEEPLYEQSSG